MGPGEDIRGHRQDRCLPCDIMQQWEEISWFKRASFLPGPWSPPGVLLAVALKVFKKSSCYLIDVEKKRECDGVVTIQHSHSKALKGPRS